MRVTSLLLPFTIFLIVTFASISATDIIISEPYLIESESDSSNHYTHPTLLADSSGVLLYNQLSTQNDVSIIGYRFSVDEYPPVAEFRKDIVYLDSMHRAPWLYDLGDRKMLYWVENNDNRDYGSVLFFEEDLPQFDDIYRRIQLHMVAREYSPAVLRIDSLLYMTQFTGWGFGWSGSPYALSLYSSNILFNLNDPDITSYKIAFGNWTAGTNALTPFNGSAVISSYIHICVDDGLTYCREYFCDYTGKLWNETSFTDYSYDEPNGTCNSYSGYNDAYSNIHSVRTGDEYFIWWGRFLKFFKANPAGQTFDVIVDFQSASGMDLGYTGAHPYTINPVKLNDGYAVFLINNLDRDESYLLVFDNNWGFKESAQLQLPESAGDFSQFEYCPRDRKIYFAYSAFMPDKYVSSRVFLQSVAIDNVTDIGDNNNPLPREFSLDQNSPNPFNASTQIKFYLPQPSKIDFSIFNVLGQKVAILVNKDLPSGEHEIIWDGTDISGKTVASGIYLYKIFDGVNELSRKMILLK